MGNLLSQIKEHLEGFNEVLSNEDVDLFLKAKEENQQRKELLLRSDFNEKEIFTVYLKETIEKYKSLDKSIPFKVEISYFAVFSVLETLFEKYGIDDEDVGIMQSMINKTIDAYKLNNYLVNKYGKKEVPNKLVLFSHRGGRVTTMSIVLVSGYESAMKNELNEGILDVLIMLLKDLPETVYSYQTQQNQQKNGCYIATCVYGSYNCPEVWVLRRYRDMKLRQTYFGRLFIKIYYSLSPSVVRTFGKNKFIKKYWKHKLDRLVEKCRSNGMADTPYYD